MDTKFVLMTPTGEYIRMYSRPKSWSAGVDYFTDKVSDLNEATVFSTRHLTADRKDYQLAVDLISKGNIKIGAVETIVRTVTLITEV